MADFRYLLRGVMDKARYGLDDLRRVAGRPEHRGAVVGSASVAGLLVIMLVSWAVFGLPQSKPRGEAAPAPALSEALRQAIGPLLARPEYRGIQVLPITSDGAAGGQASGGLYVTGLVRDEATLGALVEALRATGESGIDVSGVFVDAGAWEASASGG